MFQLIKSFKMQTNNLGYPRIGSQRQLKKACEAYWSGKSSIGALQQTGKNIRIANWQLQKDVGIDLIPSNDFSFYDQVLDMTLSVGAIPGRYQPLKDEQFPEPDIYFAMARGFQRAGHDLTAMEMTKWFDTNYHYIVPEFTSDQSFHYYSKKIISEFLEAKSHGIATKPVLIGPVTYLLLGKAKDAGFDKLVLIEKLLPVYKAILQELEAAGARWIQIDEPFLAMDLDEKTKSVYQKVYDDLKGSFPNLKFLVTTYFDGLKDNIDLATSLPVSGLHLDLMRGPEQPDLVLAKLPSEMMLSLGVIDGRNIWKNDFANSLKTIDHYRRKIGEDRLLIAPSCSLLHTPYDLALETKLSPEIKDWMAFSRQKLDELFTLNQLATDRPVENALLKYEENKKAIASRKTSTQIHDRQVADRIESLTESDFTRKSPFPRRKGIQQDHLNLPVYPTTTIGSFPQTKEIRRLRAKYKKGEITHAEYEKEIEKATVNVLKVQEDIGLDMLVHGEFERNDMVEYFGEQLKGFAFTRNGWVQSYGSRCVKPPVIFGDVSRPKPMTVRWSAFAQSQTKQIVKGMLTGPVTILQWSFVRDDQPRSATCMQIALAIRDEVADLEKAGIKAIQVDEPALREGLPLRNAGWQHYLDWAVKSFRAATSGVNDGTQIHTHMFYSEFNDIIESIADLDADVITIECSRSQMELLDAFGDFNYPNEIGPGVYDIHSPRVPSNQEMVKLLQKARKVIPEDQLWVNPDCGLKTRGWDETMQALREMVNAAKAMRTSVAEIA